MWSNLYKYAAPSEFDRLAGRLIGILAVFSVLFFAVALYGGLWLAPTDYQQRDAFRILYVHVPAAWMSLFVYMVMATAGAAGLIWKLRVAEAMALSCAPLGVSFTFLALATGSLWGRPMWGTWWEWGDARLMSELILLFLYLGYIGLQSAIADRRVAARAGAVLALVGLVNIPIIHYSVVWWSTLHQGPSVIRPGGPSIHADMLIPLLLMTVAYMLYFASVLFVCCRCELLQQARTGRH